MNKGLREYELKAECIFLSCACDIKLILKLVKTFHEFQDGSCELESSFKSLFSWFFGDTFFALKRETLTKISLLFI